jgi:hypothetical protein
MTAAFIDHASIPGFIAPAQTRIGGGKSKKQSLI